MFNRNEYMKNYMRDYRKRNPKKFKKYRSKPETKIRVRKAVKELYRKRKLELVNFMGGKCMMCSLMPEDVEGCLGVFVIDEIEPLGINKRKFTSLSKERLEGAKQLFVEGKIQLLCSNCSRIKTWKNQDTATRFNHKV